MYLFKYCILTNPHIPTLSLLLERSDFLLRFSMYLPGEDIIYRFLKHKKQKKSLLHKNRWLPLVLLLPVPPPKNFRPGQMNPCVKLLLTIVTYTYVIVMSIDVD